MRTASLDVLCESVIKAWDIVGKESVVKSPKNVASQMQWMAQRVSCYMIMKMRKKTELICPIRTGYRGCRRN